jgi:inosine-uridine nucleoside N-ribohydrolase
MERPKVWLDCDPGHDDVVAILLASHFCELIGISTVAGNAPLSATTKNALLSAQIFNIDVAVHAGCDHPLVREPVFAANIHGTSGLAGPVLPPLTKELASGHGVEALLAASHSHPGMWLVPTGPLTNIALALRLDPTLVERIEGISLMGGGPTFGNTTPWAEFNIWADPEAAAIVMRSGVNLKISGLNVTHEVLITLADAEAMRAYRPNHPRTEFLADVMVHFATAYQDVFFTEAVGPLHDPCAVLVLTHPELFTMERRHVDVELTGSLTRGMTVMDHRGVKNGPIPNASVAMEVDGPGAAAVILETLRTLVDRT